MGKLYDDRGNRMSPSFSNKNGVRYRFYVSSALLRGRKTEAGSVARVSAAEIESAVLAGLRTHQKQEQFDSAFGAIGDVERVLIAPGQLLITMAAKADGDGVNQEIRIAWPMKGKVAAPEVEGNGESEGAHNEGLILSVIRAHSWMRCLHDGVYESVELLAEASRLHPKVVRQALRLAFLSPEVTSAILEGKQPAGPTLARVPKLLPLSWMEHRRLLGCPLNTDAIKRAKSPLAAP